ncbi:hypothetical protein [Streptomyces sp. NPDC094032]|uniref:hypothetical protein n=1 Tax=Streptomyces sp. NPDC094032 TaxID=3155308 RepID=UPI00332BC2B0
MADKSDWRNHPHGHLLILVPLLVFLVIEDDVIIRGVLACSLFSLAVLYGREWAKRGGRKATADRSG